MRANRTLRSLHSLIASTVLCLLWLIIPAERVAAAGPFVPVSATLHAEAHVSDPDSGLAPADDVPADVSLGAETGSLTLSASATMIDNSHADITMNASVTSTGFNTYGTGIGDAVTLFSRSLGTNLGRFSGTFELASNTDRE